MKRHPLVNIRNQGFTRRLIACARGNLLVESTVAVVILSAVGVYLMKGATNAIVAQNWATVQNLSDASMTYEIAYAQRASFETILAENSPWPLFPSKSEQAVVLGAVPGGKEISATLYRTRIRVSEASSNSDSGAESWKLQSFLSYQIGGRDYLKTRTTIRTQ